MLLNLSYFKNVFFCFFLEPGVHLVTGNDSESEYIPNQEDEELIVEINGQGKCH